MWMNGLEMSLLHYRLRHCGFNPLRFSYPTMRSSLRDNAIRLQRFVQGIDAPAVHFVAHSLGGLLVRQFFDTFPEQRPGRIVTLATPHQGSQAARRMGHNPFGKLLLGQSYRHGLRGDVPAWQGQRELAVIAGNVGPGVGRLISRLPRPNDGTVTVGETRLPKATEHVVVPVNHTGILLSKKVADMTCRFLKTGHCLRQEG